MKFLTSDDESSWQRIVGFLECEGIEGQVFFDRVEFPDGCVLEGYRMAAMCQGVEGLSCASGSIPLVAESDAEALREAHLIGVALSRNWRRLRSPSKQSGLACSENEGSHRKQEACQIDGGP